MTCLKVQDVVDFYFRLEGISDKENLNMRNTSGFTWQLTLTMCVFGRLPVYYIGRIFQVLRFSRT